MTDADIIRHLAERVMGWKEREVVRGPGTEDMIEFSRPDRSNVVWWPGCGSTGHTWNPLESIADAIEVQMAVPADKQRAVGVEAARLVKDNAGGLWSGVSDWDMLCVNARGRCLAIVEATR